MPSAGFEPAISTDERPQTYALDRAATGTGSVSYNDININDKGLPLPFETIFLIKHRRSLFTLIDFHEILYEYRAVQVRISCFFDFTIIPFTKLFCLA
jgi:hypothetical protein